MPEGTRKFHGRFGGVLLHRFYLRLVCHFWDLDPGPEITELKGKLEVERQRTSSLQREAGKQRADFSKHRDLFAAVFKKTGSELKTAGKFTVRRSSAQPGCWEVVTGVCALGGCDLGIYSFRTERDARLFSAVLEVLGYGLQTDAACPSCYREYMMDCI